MQSARSRKPSWNDAHRQLHKTLILRRMARDRWSRRTISRFVCGHLGSYKNGRCGMGRASQRWYLTASFRLSMGIGPTALLGATSPPQAKAQHAHLAKLVDVFPRKPRSTVSKTFRYTCFSRRSLMRPGARTLSCFGRQAVRSRMDGRAGCRALETFARWTCFGLIPGLTVSEMLTAIKAHCFQRLGRNIGVGQDAHLATSVG